MAWAFVVDASLEDLTSVVFLAVFNRTNLIYHPTHRGKMNRTIRTLTVLALCAVAAPTFAQSPTAIRPISNPVFVDSVDVGTSVHPIFMHHSFPDQVATTLGKVDLGGDLQLYALQFEIQLAENWSFIAVKDGYIDFNPDNTADGMFSSESGWADLAAGVKYVVLRDPDAGRAVSVKLVAELPIGDDEVFQGNGDGTLTPAVAAVQQIGPWQLQGTIGYVAALGDEDSSLFHDSWHVSYHLTDIIVPLIELNHFHVTDAGDGGTRFDTQVGGAVPAVAQFEGGDLVNFGASNASDNSDLVSLAFGVRVHATEMIDLGVAYEIPLTEEEESILSSRFTFDAVINF